jgi:hypothetical protein
MKKLVVAALIVPLALLGAARPANAGSKAGAILTGVAVGIGAALILDAITSPPVAAAPPVVYQPAPVVVAPPPPVVYAPAPVVYTPPPVVYAPAPVVVHQPVPVIVTPPPRVVYRPAPVIVHAPRHVAHPPHGKPHHGDHGRRHWRETYWRNGR